MFNGKTHYKIFNSYVSLPEGNYLPPFTSGIFQLARFDDTWGILRLISQVFYHNIPMNNLSIIHEEPTVSHLSLPTIYSINNPWKIPVKWQDKSGCIMLYHVISCYINQLCQVVSKMNILAIEHWGPVGATSGPSCPGRKNALPIKEQLGMAWIGWFGWFGWFGWELGYPNMTLETKNPLVI